MDTYILPYPSTALQPHISSEVVSTHLARLGGLQQALSNALAGSDLAQMELDVVVASSQGQTFELAASCLNQRFFWDGLCSRSPAEPGGRIGERIKSDFGSLGALQESFSQHAAQLPADGWIWLVEQADGRLAVTSHPGIGNPLTGTSRPVLACPLDHTLWDSPGNSDRSSWLTGFWKLVNWDMAERNLR